MESLNKELKINFKYLICFVLFTIISLAIYLFLPFFNSTQLTVALYSIIMIGDAFMFIIASFMAIVTVLDIVKLIKIKKEKNNK